MSSLGSSKQAASTRRRRPKDPSNTRATSDATTALPTRILLVRFPRNASFQSPVNMLVLFSLLTLLGTLSSFTSATALTYKLTPNEKECFYTHVVKQGAKVAFYFAVQSGGSFDSALRPMRTFQWDGSADHKQLTTLSPDLQRSLARKRLFWKARKSARVTTSSLRTSPVNTASVSTTLSPHSQTSLLTLRFR